MPYVSLGEEEAAGILKLMRASTDKGLGILEQARFVADLLSIHGMSVAEVAQTLSRSKGWVSMRRSLLEGMSPAIQEILFRGAFPVYSYMYTLAAVHAHERGTPAARSSGSSRPWPGQRLSVRDIERLAHAYFRGPAALREAIAGRQAGLVARSTEARARGPGRLQRRGARAAAGPGTPAEVHRAGDGRVPRPAAGQPGFLCPSQPVEPRGC